MDLLLIAGDFFFDDVVPKEQQWLFKYFKTKPQRRFLAYYSQFAALRNYPGRFYPNFINHTGVHCTKRAMFKWLRKLKCLLSLSQEAAERFDLETLERVKSGKYRFSHANQSEDDSDIGGTVQR
jgi:hypothetical protein